MIFPCWFLKGLHHHWKYVLFLPGGLSKWKFSGGFTGKPKGAPFWGGSPNPFPLLLNPPLPLEPGRAGDFNAGKVRIGKHGELRSDTRILSSCPFLCSPFSFAV